MPSAEAMYRRPASGASNLLFTVLPDASLDLSRRFRKLFSTPSTTLSTGSSHPSSFLQQCFSTPSATLAGNVSLPFRRLPRRFDSRKSRATAPSVEAMYRRPPSDSILFPSLFLRRCLASSLYVPKSLERPSSPPSVPELLKCPRVTRAPSEILNNVSTPRERGNRLCIS